MDLLVLVFSWVIRFGDLQCGYMFTFLFMKTIMNHI